MNTRKLTKLIKLKFRAKVKLIFIHIHNISPISWNRHLRFGLHIFYQYTFVSIVKIYICEKK